MGFKRLIFLRHDQMCLRGGMGCHLGSDGSSAERNGGDPVSLLLGLCRGLTFPGQYRKSDDPRQIGVAFIILEW